MEQELNNDTQTQNPNTPETTSEPTPQTEQQTTSPEIPPEIKGWNWGAFYLNFIWGISHNVWLSLLVFIPYLGLIMPFILGAKGNEWAWQHRKFESVEQFRLVQKAWAKWALIIFIINIVFVLLFIGTIFSIIKSLGAMQS